MRRALRAFGWGLGLIVLAAATLWAVGPYERVDRTVEFDAASLPAADGLDAWLAAREAGVDALDPAVAKRIEWAAAPGTLTPWAVVYLHGFSATSEEIRPVPDAVAEALGANLHYARLSGHGRGGAAMAEPAAGDWIEDMAEAMAIGRAIGDRVLVVATSTGGTLAGLLAADPELAAPRADVAGIVLVSPNFGVKAAAARMLGWPAARNWVPLVAGAERSFEPANEAHGRFWTTRYPTVALLPMQALIDATAGLDWADATIPALFLYDPADGVVDAGRTDAVVAAWGGPVQVVQPDLKPGDDPLRHVVAGDIMSPGATPAAVAAIVAWAKGL